MVVAQLTVEAVTSFAPDGVVSIEAVAPRLNLSRPKVKLFRRIHGLDRLRIDSNISTLDLVAAPAARLAAALDDPDQIRYLVYAHTIQEVAPSYINMAEQLRARLGLDNAVAFALTQQNCASGLAAVDACGRLLAADGEPDALALVVTGEKPFSPMAQLIANTSIMGEASAACLVSLSGRGDQVVSYVCTTDGKYSDGIRLDPVRLQEFGMQYSVRLVDTVRTAVAAAGIALTNVEMIIPHNVNVSSWRRVIELLGVRCDQVFLENISEFSHCFCSDVFMNYTHLRDRGRLHPGGYYVLTAVGLGATYAAMVLRYGGGDCGNRLLAVA